MINIKPFLVSLCTIALLLSCAQNQINISNDEIIPDSNKTVAEITPDTAIALSNLPETIKIDSIPMTSPKIKENKNDLNGKWQLTSLNDKKIETNKKTPTLIVADLKISGFGGCNRYFGSFENSDNRIVIGQIGATRMACIDDNIESEFFRAIGNQSFIIKITNSSLTLLNDENSLVFDRIKE